jgi:zinc transport system substrate-binding protein
METRQAAASVSTGLALSGLTSCRWCCWDAGAWRYRSVWHRPRPPAGKLLVAATIVPLGDFCRRLGGDLVQVQELIPPGASPHLFEPAPSVMARASQGQVFVYIGAGLEPWAAKLLSAR